MSFGDQLSQAFEPETERERYDRLAHDRFRDGFCWGMLWLMAIGGLIAGAATAISHLQIGWTP